MSKKVLAPYKIITAGDLSQATVTSSTTNGQYLDVMMIQINNLTGTATGAYVVQASLDNANWTTWNISPPLTLTSGQFSGSVSTTIRKWDCTGGVYWRVLYTKTSGTGTADVYISGAEGQ